MPVRGNQLNIQHNVPLAQFTTLKVGGPARFFVCAEAEQDVIDAFGFASEQGADVFVLGGGSNILVSDKGLDGLVVKVAMKGIKFTQPNAATTLLTAAAGEDWDPLVEAAVARDLAGFECLSGIPGSVGGTPVQNVGAYGQEVSETILSVRCFDHESGCIVDLANAECGFSYRRSIFNSTERGRYVVLSVKYILTNNGRPRIAYKDVLDIFAGRQPSLAETREAVLHIRRAKSMVIDVDDPNSQSAGSFFKNPVAETSVVDSLRRFAGVQDVPFYKIDEEKVKVPAAWLIENAGFAKGFRLGNAGISTNHSLALVNLGGASAAEIVKLKELVQARVEEKFGIRLEPEPILVGF